VADFVDDGLRSGGSDRFLDAARGSSDDIDQAQVVTARGTEDGLVLRIDGKSEWPEIISDIEAFLGGRKRFFQGGQISIEWLERLPTKEQSNELETLLRDEYGIAVATRKKRPPRGFGRRDAQLDPSLESEGGEDTLLSHPGSGDYLPGVAIPLFDEVDENGDRISSLPPGGASSLRAFGQNSTTAASGNRFDADLDPADFEEGSLKEQVERFTSATLGEYYTPEGEPLAMRSREGAEELRRKYINRVSRLLGDEIIYDDDANARVVYGTLRSGQKVETPYSLVVIGDVNPGADLTAGGDIVVLGSLRGTAHASAYDDDSFDKVIIALQMRPMQLRIGSVISRGSEDVVDGAEIARIDNRRIIVETFSPRKFFAKKLR
jgi:septum formation inhibitor MinC